jgi:CheY-like chemotaxis protein
LRIVYVEDNPANLALVKRVARLGKHTVDSFTGGEEAYDELVKLPPDLILVDIQLGGAMDGLMLTRKLREAEVGVPIVAVTAYAMMGDRERCLDAGCNDYMPKPLPVLDLIELFKQYAESSAA